MPGYSPLSVWKIFVRQVRLTFSMWFSMECQHQQGSINKWMGARRCVIIEGVEESPHLQCIPVFVSILFVSFLFTEIRHYLWTLQPGCSTTELNFDPWLVHPTHSHTIKTNVLRVDSVSCFCKVVMSSTPTGLWVRCVVFSRPGGL